MNKCMDIVHILEKYDNNIPKMQNWINADQNLFLLSLHYSFTQLFQTKDSNFTAFYNNLILLLTFIEKVTENNDSLKYLLRLSSNKDILNDIIICAEYKESHVNILRVLNGLCLNDIAMKAVIDAELQSTLFNKSISEACRIGVRKICSKFKKSLSKPPSPSKTQTNMSLPGDFWSCLTGSICVGHIANVIEECQNSELLIPLSPSQFRLTFVSNNQSRKLISSIDSNELSDALGEILGAYKALPPNGRIGIKSDARNIIDQIVRGMACNELWNDASVVIRCLIFLDILLDDHADLFSSDRKSLFLLLKKYLTNDTVALRIEALKFLKAVIFKLSIFDCMELWSCLFLEIDGHLNVDDGIMTHSLLDLGKVFFLHAFCEKESQYITADEKCSKFKDLLLHRAIEFIVLKYPMDTVSTARLNPGISHSNLNDNLNDTGISNMNHFKIPSSLDMALDSVGLAFLISMPSSLCQESSTDLISKLLASLVSGCNKFSLPLASQSEIKSRVALFAFPSITVDIDSLNILQERYHSVHCLFTKSIQSKSTQAFKVYDRCPLQHESNDTGDSYTPSWTGNENSRTSENIESRKLHSPKASHDNRIVNSSRGSQELSEGRSFPADVTTSLLSDEQVDTSKLVALKRLSTRRHNSRRAFTANDAVAPNEVHESDATRVSVTSDGIRQSYSSTAVFNKGLGSIADVESESVSIVSSTCGSAVSSRRSSKSALVRLRRRQRLYRDSRSSSPSCESDFSQNTSEELSKTLQDSHLTISQVRLKLQYVADSYSSDSEVNANGSSGIKTRADVQNPLEKLSNRRTPPSPSNNSVAPSCANNSFSVPHFDVKGNDEFMSRMPPRPLLTDNIIHSHIDSDSNTGSSGHVPRHRNSGYSERSRSESQSSNGSGSQYLPRAHIPKPATHTNVSLTEGRAIDGSNKPLPRLGPGKGIAGTDDEIEKAIAKSLESAEKNGININKGNVEYLESSAIPPLSHPSSDLTRLLAIFEYETDWEILFYSLNTMRSLALHHQSTIQSSGKLHTIVQSITKQIDNLRSAVAKNAILTMGDMFQGFGRAMEGEVPATIPLLVKRFGLSSSFLSDSAELALKQMCRNVSSACALNSLLLGLDNRNGAVRGKVMSLINNLFSHSKCDDLINSKEIMTLKTKLGKLYADSSPDTRYHCRNVIRICIVSHIISRSELENILSPSAVTKCLEENMTRDDSVKETKRGIDRSISVNERALTRESIQTFRKLATSRSLKPSSSAFTIDFSVD